MTTTQAKAKLLDAAQAWHASTVLSGQRATSADRDLRRAVCLFLKAKTTARKR